MAKKFLIPIDMAGNQVLGLVLQVLASAPTPYGAGHTYYDSTLGCAQVYNGSAWVPADASKVAAGAIALSKLATDPLARAIHTGTQTAGTISNLATTVQAYSLDQFAVPAANLAFNSKRITGLADPVGAQDAATQAWVTAQVQSAAAGISSKPPVRVVAAGNIMLSGTSTIDGVAVVAGNRVLAIGQSTPSQNGPYIVAAGAWSRPTDTGTDGEVETGAMWLATEGTSYAGTQWRCATTGAITLGSTAISVVQFSAGTSFTAGNGIGISSYVISINLAGTSGLMVDGTGLYIDNTIVARKFAATIGDGISTALVVTHNLGTRDITAQVWRVASPYDQVEVDVAATSTNTATFTFVSAPAAGAYRAVIRG